MSADAARRVGPYVVERELARGGMGAVFVARHVDLNRRVALKLLLDPTRRARERFLTEARAAARIAHRNVVSIHDVGEHEGHPYLAMDLIEGEPLNARLERSGPVPARTAVHVAARLAAAVARVHSAGVLHRDIKPANVIMTPGDEPILVDFGLAKDTLDPGSLTKTGHLMGTPAYMAPEQAGQKHLISERTDVYGLGATLYALLCGHGPFEGRSGLALVAAVLREAPTPPHRVQRGVDPALSAICLRALAKDPDARQPSAGGLADELRAWLEGAPRPNAKAVAVTLGLAAVGLAAVLGAAIVLTRESEGAPPPTVESPDPGLSLLDDAGPIANPRADTLLDRIAEASAARRLERLRAWLRDWPRHPRRAEAAALLRRTHLEAPKLSLPHPECRDGALVGADRALTSAARTVILWSLDGEELNQWTFPEAIRQIAASPDGKGFATTLGSGLYWTLFDDFAQPKLVAQIPANAYTYDVAVAADGLMALGLNSREVPVIDRSGKLFRSFAGHFGRVQCVALNGSRLATGSVGDILRRSEGASGNLLRVLDRATGEELARRKLSFNPRAMAFAPGSNRLALAGEGSNVILFDDLALEHPTVLKGEGAGDSDPVFGGGAHDGWIRSVAFDSEGRRIVSVSNNHSQTSGENEIRLWDAASGRELWRATPRPHPYEDCAVTPGGSTVFAVVRDVGAEVWDLSGLDD